MAFCKNCGNQMEDIAAVCVKCGTAKGQGNSFCPNCANPTPNGMAFCTSCGVALNTAPASTSKSKLTAGLLGLFLGGWGVHNFYLGYTGKAVAQLVLTIFTCGVASVWGFIEGILILCGNINTDGNGNPLSE